jgi:Family of unknown function (DUF5996)
MKTPATPTPFPSLEGWSQTAHSLHRAAQILGAIRMFTGTPVENYLELGLRVEAFGLSSEPLPSGGSVELNFVRGELIVSSPSGQRRPILISGQTQASLLEKVLETLHSQGQALVQVKEGSFGMAFLDALHVKHHALDGSLEIMNTDRLVVDVNVAATYARVLWQAFTATSRWRSRLAGFVTPVVVWPEHFDLSTLWFATDQHDEQGSHMNFGFAPFDAEFSQPYLYAYAYPMPEGFETLPLPTGAIWHTEVWKGMVIPYSVLEQSSDPEALIESAFEAVHQTLAPSLQK